MSVKWHRAITRRRIGGNQRPSFTRTKEPSLMLWKRYKPLFTTSLCKSNLSQEWPILSDVTFPKSSCQPVFHRQNCCLSPPFYKPFWVIQTSLLNPYPGLLRILPKQGYAHIIWISFSKRPLLFQL